MVFRNQVIDVATEGLPWLQAFIAKIREVDRDLQSTQSMMDDEEDRLSIGEYRAQLALDLENAEAQLLKFWPDEYLRDSQIKVRVC